MWFWVFRKSPFRNSERNGSKRNSTKQWSFTKQLTKVVYFWSFFLLKMIGNGIPKFFLFRKCFGTEFRGFFPSENGSELNSEVFLIQKWFRMELQGFFSSEKWFRTEFQGYFSSKNGSERNSEVHGSSQLSIVNFHMVQSSSALLTFIWFSPAQHC